MLAYRPIFVRPKSDGGFRLILNLKALNQSVEYKKFKMQTLATTLCLIRPNMYMAKLDIKDAYYSIPIHKDDQKLLKFLHKGTLYKFLALPNGYTEGPRKFTKVLKPPMSVLRKKGVNVADYIDDLITMSKSQFRCYDNIAIIIKTLDELGFVIHPDKSVFTPSQEIEYLGFVIDSRDMTVTLTQAKKQTIAYLKNKFLRTKDPILKNQFKNEFKVYRNLLVALVRQRKKNHFQIFFQSNNKNLRETWKGIKSLINIHEKKNLSQRVYLRVTL